MVATLFLQWNIPQIAIFEDCFAAAVVESSSAVEDSIVEYIDITKSSGMYYEMF